MALLARLHCPMDRIAAVNLFIRVVETSSFSKAAADLGIAQPTATKAVARLEDRLGARLLHRSTRGVTPTEVGALYYEKCKTIAREIDEADNLASLLQSDVAGKLRLSTSVAFGRRVLVPQVLRYMQAHSAVTIDLTFDDRYVDLVELGADLAIRMGTLADSSLGARFLGLNPWVLAGSPAYLGARGTPASPADMVDHDCLVYSSVQGHDQWTFTDSVGQTDVVPVTGPLRSNNLSAVLAAAREGMGLAVLPWYVAQESVRGGVLEAVMTDYQLPTQEIHAVFPSPKFVPSKVRALIDWLAGEFDGQWWQR